MAEEANKDSKVDVDMMVAEVESGSRNAAGFAGKFILGLALVWAIFQLYVTSTIPFVLTEWLGVNVVFNNQETRQIHLAFGLALAMQAYPLFKGSARNSVPVYDWALALIAASSCLYLLVFKEDISGRAGLPTTSDLVFSTIGMISLGIAVYRTLGLPLVIVASVFVCYVFFGHYSFLPDAVQWKGASFGKALWHFWMQTEGVFGVALGVSASMIFLFVLFGSLLERAGAGNYFIKLAFALLGHLRGGPAKAAVVASALSGLYSGSSIANVVTTGTFTIPLMKRTGFKPEKAGAVEVASSTNGQLTPPVMGAAAFLIAEFTGVAYPTLLKHALLPAVISYIALVYIVHLEALKLGLKGMERPPALVGIAQRLSGVLFGFIAMAVLAAAVYFGLGWIKVAFPNLTFATAVLLFGAAYLFLVYVASQRPDLEVDDPNAPMKVLPRPWDVAVTGFHFLLPIVILLWCILIERLSPTLSAYWATVAMITILLTQHPLKSLFRKSGSLAEGFKRGGQDLFDGMIAGSRNMIGISVATGAAGVIVGTVSLTGAHQVVGELVEFLSGGNLMIMLLLVAVMSLILGMGLPTTANYMVVSSLMAPVIVTVGAQSGLIVPLVAVHLFVFYFGILADDTPPVGLAAFAAAAISGGDPIKTGIQGFAYDIRTALLPFLFIFNTELLLIDVGPAKAVFIFVVAVVAMMLFAAATQGYFFARSKIWESVALLLIAFTLFRPGFWLDYVEAPFVNQPGTEIAQIAGAEPADGNLRFIVRGPDFDDTDKIVDLTLVLPLGEEADGEARLKKLGVSYMDEDGKAILEEPFPGTLMFEKMQDFDFYADNPVEVLTVQTPAERMAKEVFYIPAVLLLILIVALQRRRTDVPAF
ncbi:trap transporter, 4tm/12tm fusion protein [Roseibium sp. TrichSKD4]|uniref:TRAP transporter permease n=1 Tax=Roseibium sp. TrichSKD4 TaxID=744980 RepID=UPI0001E56148|nr:TRAP transporter permease [Roseibium sp. TrichSKD4]EFO33714.1 trap transporter, 4tm/12tm fusion protein [Roseibium sp. TrichSKD4]